MPGSHILIVDDELVIRDLVATALKEHEHTFAAGGNEGFEKFCGQKFDLVISDVDMPEGSGPDMIQKIRLRKPDQLVLVLSGNQIELNELSQRLPVATMRKPFRTTDFRMVVHELLKKE